MGFVLWLVYLGLVACCCSSWTNTSVSVKVDPPRLKISCATNIIQNSGAQNGTNLLGESWLQVQPEELLVLELNYHCAKSSSLPQGANGPLFDVIRVETKSAQPIENICLSDERRNARAVLTFERGLEPYRITAVNTGSSQHVCVLFEYSSRIQRSISGEQRTLGDPCRFDNECGDNQVCWQKRCQCGIGFCEQLDDRFQNLICKECTTPASTNCTADADCIQFGFSTSECGPQLVCQCKKNCLFDNGKCLRDYATDYELAVKIALVAAIIIAVGILLAILYNTMRVRTLRNSGESTFTRQRNVRRSLDSLQRLVEGLLLDRPPPYSISNDKPPTYDEATRDVPTDNNGNTTTNNGNNTIATLANPEPTASPPPYSMPYINPAFETEEMSANNPPDEDPFAILRIPLSRGPAGSTPPTSVTIEMQADTCSHL